jgi:hypothetical protein
MKFYFDIEFLDGLQKKDELDELTFDDFKYFVSKSLKNEECVLIGEDNLDNQKLTKTLFYRLLNQNTKSLELISRKDFVRDLEDPSDTCFKFIFFNEIIPVTDIRENFGLYAYSSDELNEVWRKFYARRSTDDLKRYIDNKKTKYSFSSWKDLNEFSLPFNTFIITDQYLFETKESFRYNFYELLKSIGLKPLKKRKVNIVIITSDKIFESEKGKNKTDNKKIISFIQSNYKERIDQNFDLKPWEINDLLFEIAFLESKKVILKLLKASEFNFTLIKLDKKSNPKSTKAHYRGCFTNTTFLNCGHSFTIFDTKGNIRKEDYIQLSSLLWEGPRNNISSGIVKVASQALNNINNYDKYYDRDHDFFYTPIRIKIFNEEIKASSFEVKSDESAK